MQTVVITGANRGIGFELAKQLSHHGRRVIAICRNTSEALDGLAGVTVESGIDITQTAGIDALAERLAGVSVDVLINNAGLLIGTQFDHVEDELAAYRQQFEVNTLAPLRVTRALIDNLGEGSKVVIITSRMGSIADNTTGGQYAYRISKAGVNSAGVSLAHELAPKGIAVGLLHPGYVRTGMTRQTGHIDPDEAAGQLIQRIDDLDMGTTGAFVHANGESLPW
jgi:NAD(P)-dependent dehydrogenase (short-subunit alcohol dehydrogenase family)